MEDLQFPIADPTPDLSPTARRLLEAGVRVLEQDGPAALTFERIAHEAGENPALIRYHFGNKAGLMSFLVDVVLYAQSAHIIRQVASLPPGKERRRALFRRWRDVTSHPTRFRLVFDLIPLLIRDPALRPKLRDVIRWYTAFDVWALSDEGVGGVTSRKIEGLATLTSSLVYGMALQLQADPDLDVQPAFDLWEEFVAQYLEQIHGDAAAADS